MLSSTDSVVGDVDAVGVDRWNSGEENNSFIVFKERGPS